MRPNITKQSNKILFVLYKTTLNDLLRVKILWGKIVDNKTLVPRVIGTSMKITTTMEMHAFKII